MRVVLIAPTPPDLSAFGVRSISAYLKSRGHAVNIVFLPGGVARLKYKAGYVYRYDPRVLEELASLCMGADLVGVSLMTNYFDRAVQITENVKEKVGAPVIWGGIHPTVRPAEALEYADMVCIGDGEEALEEILKKMGEGRDYTDTPGVWFRVDGDIRKNPFRPLVEDLDSLPFYDYDLEDHYVYHMEEGRIVGMTPELLRLSFPREPSPESTFYDPYGAMRRTYKTYTVRGCPHSCHYCSISIMKEMFPDQKHLRKRSVPNIIGELKEMTSRFPFIEGINIFDDTFVVRGAREIEEFCRSYKEEIGLPFYIQVSPATVTEEKMAFMVDAGLVFAEMGVQTGNERTRAMFNRGSTNGQILKAARIVSGFTSRMFRPCYHVILDNPWETSAEAMETLDLLLELPTPFWLKRSSLVPFPGTKLYDIGKRDGWLTDERKQIYAKHLHTPYGSYPNFLIYLAGYSCFPRRVLRLLRRKPFTALLDRKGLGPLYALLCRLGDWCIVLFKGVKSVLIGDTGRLRNFIKKIR